MDLYFAGAEQPVYARLLHKYGVRHVAISFFEWQRRYSTSDVYRHIPEDMEVCITAGVSRKEGLDFGEFSQNYLEFCEANAERAVLYDMDAPACPEQIRKSTRHLLSLLPRSVVFPIDETELPQLVMDNERIGINSRLAKSLPAPDLRRLPASLYGSNITDARMLRMARFTATTTLLWLNSRRFGELWVYSRGKLRHYQDNGNLARAVRAHRADLEALGVDPAACEAREKDALTHAAVKSFQALADALTRRPRDRNNDHPAVASRDEGVGERRAEREGATVTPLYPEGVFREVQRNRKLLPTIGVREEEGEHFVSPTHVSLRQCDSCYLSSVCPEYQEGQSCAFAMPVEFRTQADIDAANETLLTFQFQRVAFGHFAEQAEGGTLNRSVGQEMDRFLSMATKIKDLQRPDPAQQIGALQRLFGDIVQPQALRGTAIDAEEIEVEDISGEEEDTEGEEAGGFDFGITPSGADTGQGESHSEEDED